jgi:hypothetical protein
MRLADLEEKVSDMGRLRLARVLIADRRAEELEHTLARLRARRREDGRYREVSFDDRQSVSHATALARLLRLATASSSPSVTINGSSGSDNNFSMHSSVPSLKYLDIICTVSQITLYN